MLSSEKEGSFGSCATSPRERANELDRSYTPMEERLGICQQPIRRTNIEQLNKHQVNDENTKNTTPKTCLNSFSGTNRLNTKQQYLE